MSPKTSKKVAKSGHTSHTHILPSSITLLSNPLTQILTNLCAIIQTQIYPILFWTGQLRRLFNFLVFITPLHWNRNVHWLAVQSYIPIFNQSECIILALLSYPCCTKIRPMLKLVNDIGYMIQLPSVNASLNA